MKAHTLLISLLLASSSSFASFDETARRYMSGTEIIQSLQSIIPLNLECSIISARNTSLLGINSPATGNPISSAPTQATIQWIMKCVNSAMNYFPLYEESTQKKVKQLIGEDLFLKFRNDVNLNTLNDYTVLDYFFNKPWQSLKPEMQEQLITNVVRLVLGDDDIIKDYGIIDPDYLRSQLREWPKNIPNAQVKDVLRFVLINLTIRDEFLSY